MIHAKRRLTTLQQTRKFRELLHGKDNYCIKNKKTGESNVYTDLNEFLSKLTALCLDSIPKNGAVGVHKQSLAMGYVKRKCLPSFDTFEYIYTEATEATEASKRGTKYLRIKNPYFFSKVIDIDTW